MLLLVAIIVIMFILFWMVGYDMPFDDDPAFTAPLFTDVLIWFVYLLIAAALAVICVSVIHGVRAGGISEKIVCGVPVRRIKMCSAALLVVTIVLTFVFASVEPLRVNGRVFASAGWLRLTDMFINTSVTLITVGVTAVTYSLTGLHRKQYHRKRR